MKNSYRDAMDALRFTPEQKADMVEHLLSAPAAGKVVRPLRFRRFAAAGAAAALVLSLGVAGATGALGSAGDAFAGLFGGGAAETEIIDQIGYPIGASATSNGVTITADAIVGDTYSYAIVYSIQRDDGQPLLSDELLSSDNRLPLEFDSQHTTQDNPQAFSDDGWGTGSGTSYFYDADPADSAVQYVKIMTHDNPIQPCDVTATFQNLYDTSEGHWDGARKLLAAGPWKLEFHMAFEDSSVSLDAGQDFTLNGMSATLDAVILSPLSIVVEYTVHQELPPLGITAGGESTYASFVDLPIVITYTDGSTLDAGGNSGMDSSNGCTLVQADMVFETLRPLDEVASVTVGDIVLPVSAGG